MLRTPTRRPTSVDYHQRPGRWLLRVSVKIIDGEISCSHRWTRLGRILRRIFRGWPRAEVFVVRKREIALPSSDSRR